MNKYLVKIAEMQEKDNHFWRNAAMGGATLGAVAGGALLARRGLAKFRTPKTFSDISPAHKQFHEDMENYRKDIFHYHIFTEGNAQRIPYGVEETLRSKYPLQLASPSNPKSFKNSAKDDDTRKIVADYIRHNKIPTREPEEDWGWSLLYPDITKHLHETERAKARDIVAQHVKDHI